MRRTAIRSREPALKPGISTRTIDRPGNSSNNSNSNEDQQQQIRINNCDNTVNHNQRRVSSEVERECPVEGVTDLVIQTTSEKRRCMLTKIRDEDLKFIDTSVDSDNNNYLIRNLTNARPPSHRNSGVEIVSDDSDVEGGNRGEFEFAEKADSALEDEDKDDSIDDGGTEEKGMSTLTMNGGNEYLAVLVEPSSSSGIDVALDQDESTIQPV